MLQTIEDFTSERYLPLETALLQKTNAYLSEIEASAKADWSQALQACFADIVKVQASTDKDCHYLTLSFLYTSLPDGKPCFRLNCYEENWDYERPWYKNDLAAGFLFAHWEEFCQSVLNDKYYVRSQLKAPRIKSLFWGTARQLLYLFTSRLKYWLYDICDSDAFRSIRKDEDMFVTCGEYLDWQETLYAVLLEIDLLDRWAKSKLQFHHFYQKKYYGSNFAALNLRHSIFYQCSFVADSFENIDFTDAHFIDCRFEQIAFKNCLTAGSIWQNCTWKAAIWSYINADPENPELSKRELFAGMKFINSSLNDVRFEHCNLSQSLLQECTVEDITMTGNTLAGSDFSLISPLMQQ